MDAVKFMKEWDRMCRSYGECENCPLDIAICDGGGTYVRTEEEIKAIVKAVEKWSRKNSEHVGKKYVIEIDEDDGGYCRIKGKNAWWVVKSLVDELEEYQG